MFKLPFIEELEKSENVLVAGAGGGYDIFSGLPLYFALRKAGKNVHLANLSFSPLPVDRENRLTSAVLKVTPKTEQLSDYFPEKYLAEWFRKMGDDVPIYSFERTGVRPLAFAYSALAQDLKLDTIVLVDGGTDSLMRGDEAGLGTPHEDIASIVAVSEIKVKRKLLACLGFGIDAYHGVCHAHFLEAVADLTRSGNYLGMFSLLNDMPEVRQYRAATEAVFKRMPSMSIVSSSILSALAGNYGDHHATARTQGSELWINPLMPVYFNFQLAGVAKRILYREAMLATNTFEDVDFVIEEFRYQNQKRKARVAIPV